MKKYFYIPLLALSFFAGSAQDLLSSKVNLVTVDDKTDGYILFAYKIPSDGHYTFSADGGLLPEKSCTIYYCEYLLQLRSNNKKYNQEMVNVASQAQDGNICYFHTNEKNNKVSGTFSKDDVVELRLIVVKSDVNGQPHHQLSITENTLVSVQQSDLSYAGPR